MSGITFPAVRSSLASIGAVKVAPLEIIASAQQVVLVAWYSGSPMVSIYLGRKKVACRILSFDDMEDGWGGSGSLAPPARELRRLAVNFRRNFCPELPLPAVFPTHSGGVEMEWSPRERTVIVDIPMRPPRAATLFAFYTADEGDDRDVEETIELRKINGWKLLHRLLRAYFCSE